MIDVSIIMSQLEQWLRDSHELRQHTISRGEPVNEIASEAARGWIGIYRRNVDYDPRNLGVPPNNYEADLTFSVVVQRTDIISGASAEDSLEESVKWVLDRVVTIPRTYVDHFSDVTVEYTYIEAEPKSMYFQGALVTFTARVSIEVGG